MTPRRARPEPPPSINEEFRASVTDVAFHLSLSRAMCCGLVGLKESIDNNQAHLPTDDGPWARAFSNWATTAAALKRRGLFAHEFDPDHSYRAYPGDKEAIWDPEKTGIKWHYALTPAGELVCELLKQAGIYQDIVPGLRWWNPRVA